MTFATEVVRPDRGRALRFDFSYDDFSTVTYRLSDVEGKLDGTNWYTPRVVSCGSFRRGFGQNRIAASGGFELVIANTDGAYDALCNRASIDDTAKLRIRAYVVLYGTTTPVTSFTSQQLGEYICDRWPRRDNDVIRLTLADDILGPLSQGVVLPRLLDWSSVGTSATNPLYNGAYYPDTYNVYSPVQLAFGEDWVKAFPLLIPRDPHANYAAKVIVPICCTTDTTTAASDAEITELRISFPAADGSGRETQFQDVPQSNAAGSDIWNVERSPTITVDNKSFKVIYLKVDIDAFYAWLWPLRSAPYPDGSGTPQVALQPGTQPWVLESDGTRATFSTPTRALYFATTLAYVFNWYVKGYPLSARTYTAGPQQHATDVMKDLVTYYSKQALSVDSTAFSTVKAMRASMRASGVVQPWADDTEGGRKAVRPPSMRSVLTGLCQSSDLDVFMDWAGDVSVSTDGYTFELAAAIGGGTVVELEEERVWATEEWMPSHGERGAPFNRLYMEGGRPSPADGLDTPFQGPWDFDSSSNCGVAQASRIIEATLQQGWRPAAQTRLAPFSWRVLEVMARPRIRFRTFLDALRLDLGDYFYLPWGRNVSSPYATAQLWQVETLVYSPQDDTVEVEAAWRNNLVTDSGYLLDDMTMSRRVYATFGRTATVTDASLTVNFSSGDLNADGVEAGDVLVLQDTTQADDVFSRNRALYIRAVNSATELEVATSDSDFDAPTGVAVAEWNIYRGATTYHTAVSDPTNYPSGGAMYGKATNTSGAFSDASTGNRLLDG